MNQPSLQQEMSTYADVKARCARIVTRLEAIATDPNATPADPRDLFIRLELLSYGRETLGLRDLAPIYPSFRTALRTSAKSLCSASRGCGCGLTVRAGHRPEYSWMDCHVR
jgi:hypothetical protein